MEPSQSRAVHLSSEIGTWALGPEAPESDRARLACTLLRADHTEHERFLASRIPPGAVVAVELTIETPGRALVSVHRELPTPITLLVLAARHCRPGTVVRLTQRTAANVEFAQVAHWPFGMDAAERLTRTAAEQRRLASGVS